MSSITQVRLSHKKRASLPANTRKINFPKTSSLTITFLKLSLPKHCVIKVTVNDEV